MSTVFPNRPEPTHSINLEPLRDHLQDVALRQAEPPVAPPSASHARKTPRFARQLTPAKLGFAWEKVRRVVRDHCRQRGEKCLICRPYGNQIEFQLTAEYLPITLDLEGDRIVARIGGKHWTIRMVRIRSGGSGYEFRKKIRTATFLLIELIKMAQSDEHLRARNSAFI